MPIPPPCDHSSADRCAINGCAPVARATTAITPQARAAAGRLAARDDYHYGRFDDVATPEIDAAVGRVAISYAPPDETIVVPAPSLRNIEIPKAPAPEPHPEGHMHPRHARPRTDSKRLALPNIVEFKPGEIEALREYRDLRLHAASSVSYTERAVHDRAYQVIDRILAPTVAAEAFRDGRIARARTLNAELALAHEVKDLARVSEIVAELTELGARYVTGQGYTVE